MSERLPQASGLEVMRALERGGWVKVRQSKHAIYRKPGHPQLVPVPAHRTALKRKTLVSILRLAGLTVDEFKELL